MNLQLNSFMKLAHQWLGLIGGWFLFLLVISGSLALFDTEVTQWMQPELAQYKPAPLSGNALNQAYKIWLDNQKQPKNIIILPTDRYPYLRVVHIQDKLLQGPVLDANQGNILPVRPTAGGYLIDSFHKSLLLDRYWGGMLLLGVSILFLISILSGLFIHYRSFLKTLFNLQLKASPLRIQLNLHSTIGMFFLPFLLIIGISAFLFLIPRYLPSSSSSFPAFPHTHKQHFPQSIPSNLDTIIQQAQDQFHIQPGLMFFTPKEIKLVEQAGSHLALSKDSININMASQKTSAHIDHPGPLILTQQTLFGIHMGRTGGLFLRVSYFILGILSAGSLFFGFLYYMNRKLKYSFCDRILRGITTGITLASPIAFIALFWINRLLPIEQINRIHTETTLFLSIFCTIFFYGFVTAFMNKARWAWLVLFPLLIALCLLLPALDFFTLTSLFMTAIANHNYLYVTIDGIIFCFGLIFLKLFFYLRIKNFI